jgi:hypothetical protein
MPENLTEIRDRPAHDRLHSLLIDAVAELRTLAIDPIVIAACPAKFNDASNDEDWEAVQVGSFHSERTTYFGKPEDYDRQLAEGPGQARFAAHILQKLKAAHWRDLYKEAFGRVRFSCEEVIALVLQDRNDWLVLDGSNTGESAIYAINSHAVLRHVGHTPPDEGLRFDQRIGRERPLLIRTLEENEAGRAAIETRLSELERLPVGQPLWTQMGWAVVRGMQSGARPQSFKERLQALGRTGRITREEHYQIWHQIGLNNLD